MQQCTCSQCCCHGAGLAVCELTQQAAVAPSPCRLSCKQCYAIATCIYAFRDLKVLSSHQAGTSRAVTQRCSRLKQMPKIYHTISLAGVMPALAAALTAMHAAAKRCAPKPLDPSSHELAAALLSLWNPLMVSLQSPTPVGLLCPVIGPTVAPAANLAAALMRGWQVRHVFVTFHHN